MCSAFRSPSAVFAFLGFFCFCFFIPKMQAMGKCNQKWKLLNRQQLNILLSFLLDWKPSLPSFQMFLSVWIISILILKLVLQLYESSNTFNNVNNFQVLLSPTAFNIFSPLLWSVSELQSGKSYSFSWTVEKFCSRIVSILTQQIFHFTSSVTHEDEE